MPNKFPALQVEGTLDRQGEGLFDRMNGIGAHEVIIETPRPRQTLATMSEPEIEQVLWAFRERVLDLKQDRRLPLHPHLQEPRRGGRRDARALAFAAHRAADRPARGARRGGRRARALRRRRSAASSATSSGRRWRTAGAMIAENADMVAIAPYAPRFPFETWMLPKRHEAHFEEAPRHEYASLARLLGDMLRRMNRALESPPYNLLIHSAPFARARRRTIYHWHVEIIPKLTKVAGFEWATGFYINPTSPEEAARVLRAVGFSRVRPGGEFASSARTLNNRAVWYFKRSGAGITQW